MMKRQFVSSVRRSAGTTLVLLTLVAAGCGEGLPVQGRYYKGLNWIEFGANGQVRHGELGDTARFRVDTQDRQKVVIFDGSSQTTGRIVNGTSIEFPIGDSSLASAFAGMWVTRGGSAGGGRSASAAADPSVLVGEWRIAGETDVLAFRPDGSYQWGPRINGTFTMLAGQRVRMTVAQDGKPMGHLDSGFVIEGAELRLTAPDGVVTKYERVSPQSSETSRLE
jgi:hypothetical protein